MSGGIQSADGLGTELSGCLDPDQLRARVGAELEHFLGTQLPTLREAGEQLRDLDELVRGFVLGGGKRLRPAFAYAAYLGAGGGLSGDPEPSDSALLRAVASLELLHAFALVHDDLMDGSDLRRGHPAVHRQFEAAHARRGWSGPASRFGAAAAILTGDLLMVLSDELLDLSGLPAEALRRARRVFGAMRVQLVAGQYLDVAGQVSGAKSVEHALRVARYKSGKYTVEAPMHLGAAIAGADEDVFAAYSTFALPLGEAFQLRDDLLGVFGDSAETGKPSGEDLREGKRTVLVAVALDRVTPSQRARFEQLLGDLALDQDGVDELRRAIVVSGAQETVERMIAERARAALSVLESAPLHPAGREALRALAVAATDRTR